MTQHTPNDKTRGVSKGAPSGFLVSLAVHVGAFLLAGMLVVFSVTQKKEKKFTPPKPVDRPKMKLKKPKVKVKKNAKPKATNRIVTKITKADMPDIRLPEMAGIGGSLGDGGLGGGFDLMPDIKEVSQFGMSESIGSDLEGTYYDFNKTRTGTPSGATPEMVAQLIDKFFGKGWSPRVFAPYYRSPKKLYTTCIAIPPLQSIDGPEAFGEVGGAGWCWLVHYKGQLVYPKDIRFRFWGFGDDILAVRVGGEIKLLACFPEWITDFDEHTVRHWESTSVDNRKYPMANHHSVVGDWIELKANEPQDLEILIGESHGGIFSAMLVVEVEGVEYDRNPHRNGPCLPFFKTAEFSQDMYELINNQLQPGEATCDLGPVFNDYDSVGPTQRIHIVYNDDPAPPPPPLASKIKPELRTWTTAAGKTLEAKYKTDMGKSAVLETAKGKQIRVELRELSEDDRNYVSLMNPPSFKLDLSKTSNLRKLGEVSIWLDSAERRLQVYDWQFGARIKQTSPYNGYTHPLTVEYFVFGDEVAGDNFVLLDRNKDTYIPSPENKGNYELYSEKEVETRVYALYSDVSSRGTKYGGYLITVTDERGDIVQYAATHEFLFKNIENLKKVPVGKHFNKNCNRCMPDRPGEEHRCTWN